MATEVFISWSGDLSRKLGDALREWLPSVLQYVKPYFSPEDIQKGTKWNTEIAKELESADIGVICLTLENIEKPWILFEAGALSKSIDKARVCTLLFGIEPADVKGPLTSFQSTRFNRNDFKRLITTVNNTAGNAKLDAGVLDSVFDMWWPKLESKVQDILQSHEQQGEEERRSDRDILAEVLELARTTATMVSEFRADRDSRARGVGHRLHRAQKALKKWFLAQPQDVQDLVLQFATQEEVYVGVATSCGSSKLYANTVLLEKQGLAEHYRSGVSGSPGTVFYGMDPELQEVVRAALALK